MRKRIISENFENRMHELSGIIQENAHKIMKLGFDNAIADYLAGIDKKRGMFFADSLTKQYIKDKGLSDLEVMSTKQAISSINQEELYSYMKSRENDILMISEWVKLGQGKVDLKSFSSFNEIASTASEQLAPTDVKEEFSFSPQIEGYLRSVDYDFGVDIGIAALKGFFKYENPEININEMSLGEIFQSINERDFYRFLLNSENDMSVIVDWINSPLRQEQEGPVSSDFISSVNFQNIGDMMSIAEDWHTNIDASGKIQDHNAGRVIRRYPEGFYWVDLQTNSSKDEAQAMGHCGTDSKATTLFSLRNKKGEPNITIAYNERTNNVTQVKGRGNQKPSSTGSVKYMKYVNEFLIDLVKKDKLGTFNWSYGPDLSSDETKEILSNMSAKAKFKMAKMAKVGLGGIGVRGGNLR
jgi:hypothetical protein